MVDRVIRELGRENYDLLITCPSVLSQSEQDVVAAIASLPEPPEIIIVSEEDNSEERAQLLAAGRH